jgi:hypothetical protein
VKPDQKTPSIFVFSLLVLASLSSGCASIANGPRQRILVNSAPTRALYTVFDLSSGKQLEQGRTPIKLNLRRGRPYMKGRRYRLVIESPGHEPRTIDIEPRVSAFYVAGNLVSMGPVGWLLFDPLTGAMWDLFPSDIMINFNAAQPPAAE